MAATTSLESRYYFLCSRFQESHVCFHQKVIFGQKKRTKDLVSIENVFHSSFKRETTKNISNNPGNIYCGLEDKHFNINFVFKILGKWLRGIKINKAQLNPTNQTS